MFAENFSSDRDDGWLQLVAKDIPVSRTVLFDDRMSGKTLFALYALGGRVDPF